VSDTTDTEALARELLLAAADCDTTGVAGAFLAINDLDDVTRNLVLGRVDALGVRAIRALAHVLDVSNDEALSTLTF
jgi:hypothetical protein